MDVDDDVLDLTDDEGHPVDELAMAALAYAERGWPVFPLNGRIPLTPHGFYDASTDPAVVRANWTRYPRANIGLRTGAERWVLDVDPRHGGDTALAALLASHGPLPPTIHARTPRLGDHFHFGPDSRVGTSRGTLPAGLDVRGVGGYVVLPPSIDPETGRAWVWEVTTDWQRDALASAPAWLVDRILEALPRGAGAEDDEPVQPGCRHEFLLREGGKLAWLGASDAAITAHLQEVNAMRCQPPLPAEGQDGWRRLLPTLRKYGKQARARRRAQRQRMNGAGAPGNGVDDQVDDQTGHAAAAEEWLKPLPLEPRQVPDFPTEVLPPVLWAVVEDIARVNQLPIDLPGVLVLGAIGGLCARRVDIAIGRTHVEPLNLYCLAIAESGQRKGPALRSVLKPLSLLEIRLQTDALPTHRSADEARRLAERRLEHLRATAARAKNDNERRKAEDEAIAMAQTMPTVPVPPTLLVDDLTVEKLEIEIAQQDGALILASEEAGNLFAVAGGRYTRDGGSQLDTYLKCYDRGPIHTARISRAPVRCPTPELTILVTPQPVVLQQLRTRTEFHHRGLWPRCLFAVPTGKVGERAYDLDAHASELVHAAYTVLVNRLHAACARQPAGEPLPHLRLEGESLAIWAEYHDRVERALREGERLASLREWGSKHPGRVARLCGILHLATHDGVGSGFIAPATIRAAVTLGEYFEVHALLAYDLLATIPELANARAVVRWLQRKQLSTFSVRDAHHALQHRFPTVAMLLPCLELLVEYGYTRPLPLPIGKPGRPSPQFAVHPRIVPPAGGAA